MKKYLIIAFLAIGMVGCTNEEEVVQDISSPAQITLNAVTKKASRGALRTNTLTEGSEMYVTGLLRNQSGTASAFHFKNQTFTGTNNLWQCKNTILWPIDGTLEMWGYICTSYNYNNVTGTDSEGNPVSKTEIEVTNGASATPACTPLVDFGITDNKFSTMTLDFKNLLNGQYDVMYCDTVQSYCTNRDYQNSNIYPTLKYKHALAWIVVNISTPSTFTGMRFSSITLDDVKTSGKLLVNADPSSKPVWTPYREEGESNDSYSTINFASFGTPEAPVTISQVKGENHNGILVLPQAQTSITLHYAYMDADGNFGDVANDLVHKIDLSDTSKYPAWEAGNKYIYTITFSSDNTIILKTEVEHYTEITYDSSL